MWDTWGMGGYVGLVVVRWHMGSMEYVGYVEQMGPVGYVGHMWHLFEVGKVRHVGP